MPSKKRNANNPLGFSALGGAASLGDSVQDEIGKRSPRASMDCGQIQMPNQVILVPKKRLPVGGTAVNPWRVSISSTTVAEVTTWTVSITIGTVVDGLLSHTTVTVVNNLIDGFDDPVEVEEDDLIVLTYTYATDTPTDEIYSVDVAPVDGSYEPYDEDEEDPPNVIAVRYPLAQIISDGGTGLKVEQFARDHLGLTTICYDGIPLKYFLSL